MMRRLRLRVGLLAGAVSAAAVLLIGGCPPEPQTSDNTKAVLKPFADGSELVSYFRTQVRAANHVRSGLAGLPFLSGGDILAPAANDATGGAETDGQAGGDSYSTTNLQEEGVDESDVLKTDGTYFYIAKGTTLRVVRATPLADMEEVGRVTFDVPVDSMYLFGGKLLVLGQKYTYEAPEPGEPGMPEIMIWPPYYAGASVVVSEVDVSDPGDPTVTATNELDGSLVTSRLTNDRLIIVLTITPTLPATLSTTSISGIEVDEVLPQMRTADGAEPFVAPENWYHPDSPDGYNTTAVVTLDAADIEAVVGSVAVMASAGTVYASTEAVYLTDTTYNYDGDARQTTAIHKLTFDEDGVARYTASGSVPGRLLNQFSLGEQDGYLRVATHFDDWGFAIGGVGVGVAEASGAAARAQDTDAAPPDETTTSEPDGSDVITAAPEADPPFNAVYVLGEQNGELTVVGQVEGIAPGEQLYAARFLGARGFLVTFLQIDPLFVLDLADPEKPEVVGELEIPGYSDYLHPLGDNLLIGVGRSTTTFPGGGTIPDAVQLSLFDVSDLANPTLIDQLKLGGYGSSTDVSWTHKAFAILPDRNLLAIPAQVHNEHPEYIWGSYVEFDGVVCFAIDPAQGFTEVGRVASVVHSELGWADWHRPAFIGDTVYAVTPAGVRGAALDDFAHPEMLELEPNADELNPPWVVDGGGGVDGSTSPGRAAD